MNGFLGFLKSLFVSSNDSNDSSDRFSLVNLQAIFDQMAATPGFDVERPLIWGYFFVSSSEEKLAPIRAELVSKGYNFVRLEPDEDGMWWLEINREEIHSPESLHGRNLEMIELAGLSNGVTYDGWDVTRSADLE